MSGSLIRLLSTPSPRKRFLAGHDLVLLIDRRFDRAVQIYSDKHLPDGQSLEWADSSGNRSVHLFMVDGEQQDLPFRTFQLFKEFLLERHTDVDLLMIRKTLAWASILRSLTKL